MVHVEHPSSTTYSSFEIVISLRSIQLLYIRSFVRLWQIGISCGFSLTRGRGWFHGGGCHCYWVSAAERASGDHPLHQQN